MFSFYSEDVRRVSDRFAQGLGSTSGPLTWSPADWYFVDLQRWYLSCPLYSLLCRVAVDSLFAPLKAWSILAGGYAAQFIDRPKPLHSLIVCLFYPWQQGLKAFATSSRAGYACALVQWDCVTAFGCSDESSLTYSRQSYRPDQARDPFNRPILRFQVPAEPFDFSSYDVEFFRKGRCRCASMYCCVLESPRGRQIIPRAASLRWTLLGESP